MQCNATSVWTSRKLNLLTNLRSTFTVCTAPCSLKVTTPLVYFLEYLLACNFMLIAIVAQAMNGKLILKVSKL